MPRLTCITLLLFMTLGEGLLFGADKDADIVKTEHAGLGMVPGMENGEHTRHPDAQWFPDAGLGLFIHWGIFSVKGMNCSWPMMAGLDQRTKLDPTLANDPAYRTRLLQERDFNLNGKRGITPREYWTMAEAFIPENYHPEHWLKEAKAAGFTYAVLTTKHHDGFALWPSAYGDFNTKRYLGGRDLVGEFVAACRANGLRVGLYFSGVDWYFDREYQDFLGYTSKKLNPGLFPALDADHRPRSSPPDPAALRQHQIAYVTMMNGQIEELLTRYGTVDLMWFDGRPPVGKLPFITQDRMRELQPGIVINPRLHGKGDYQTPERSLTITQPVKGWAELCKPWTSCWSHVDGLPFRSTQDVLGDLVRCRSLGINYLLGIGPTRSGECAQEFYEALSPVARWMAMNRDAVTKVKPLPPGEKASVPATATTSVRYLFAINKDANTKVPGNAKDPSPSKDLELTLEGAPPATRVVLTHDGLPLPFSRSGTKSTITLPAARRGNSVDVVRVEL